MSKLSSCSRIKALSAAADGSASKYIAVEIAPDGAPTCGSGCGEEAVADGGAVHRIAQRGSGSVNGWRQQPWWGGGGAGVAHLCRKDALRHLLAEGRELTPAA